MDSSDKKEFYLYGRESLIKAENLIKSFEGLETTAYLCPAGILTIGYGHTGNVAKGQTITEVEADKLLEADVLRLKDRMTPYVKVPVTEGQFVALMSFTYNVGIGNFKKSTLLRNLNDGKEGSAALQFERWIYAKGKPLSGLIRRREAERKVFLQGS